MFLPVLKRLFRAFGPRTEPLREYESFDAALRDSDTYEHPAVIDIVSKKTDLLRRALSAGGAAPGRQGLLDALVVQTAFGETSPRRGLEVVEIGGACGATFFEVDSLLPGRIARWSVVETPAMAQRGRERFADGRLAFFDDLDAALQGNGHRDLLVAKAVMQYVPAPLSLLEKLLTRGFRFCYFARNAFGREVDRPTVVLHSKPLSSHGPGTLQEPGPALRISVPLTLLPLAGFCRCVEAAGLGVALRTGTGDPDETWSVGARTIRVFSTDFLLERASP